MKTLMLTAFLLAAPAAAFAQSAPDAAPQSKVNVAVRADMAQAEARAETRSAGSMTARSARVGGKTIRLVDGSLPADIQSASATQDNPGI